MKPMTFQQVEEVAAWLCNKAGGNWAKPYTKRNVWRRRAMALECLARGDMAGAKRIMRGDHETGE